jgi:preprotein translocase subunit SecD
MVTRHHGTDPRPRLGISDHTEGGAFMSGRLLLPLLLLCCLLGCSESKQMALEMRVAEDEPGPGLTEVVFAPTGEHIYLHEEVLVNQADIDSAYATTQQGDPAVQLLLTPAGAHAFQELTESNLGKRCGVLLDGELVSAPRIMAPIRDGRVVLMADFTAAEAQRIAERLSPSD